MKKAATIFALLFAGFLGAMPWINGMVMERFVETALAQMNHNSRGGRFELVSYHRGYARTVAEWRLTLGSLAPLTGLREIRFTEQASHGWAGVTSETRLDKNEWYARLEKDPLSIRTRYGLWGPIITTITLDALTLNTENGPLAVGALDLVLSAERSFDQVTARGNWEGMSGNSRARMENISVESKMKRLAGPVWQGRTMVSVEKLLAEDPASKIKVAVSDLEIIAEAAADEKIENMAVALKIAAGDVAANGRSLSAWVMGGKIRQMDIRAYQEMERFYGDLAVRFARILSDPALGSEQRIRVLKNIAGDSQFQAITHMEKMLKKGFGLEISPLDITLPRGRIRGKLSVSLLREMSLAGFLPVALRPGLIPEIFSLVSRLELSQGFQELAPYLTIPLFHGMKTGIFVLKEGRLFHQARTLDEKLYLNGQVVDLGRET